MNHKLEHIHCVAQTGLKIRPILLLSRPSEFWDSRHVLQLAPLIVRFQKQTGFFLMEAYIKVIKNAQPKS